MRRAAARRRPDAPRRDGHPRGAGLRRRRRRPAAHRGGHARVADAAAVRRPHRRAAGPRDRLPRRPRRQRWRREASRPRSTASARRGGCCAPRARRASPRAWPTACRTASRRPAAAGSRSPAPTSSARRRSPRTAGCCRRRCEVEPGEPLTIAWVCAPAGPRLGRAHDDVPARLGARAGRPPLHPLPRRRARLGARAARADHPLVVAVGQGRGARRSPPASRTPTRSSRRRGRPPTRCSPRPRAGTRFYLVQDFEPSFYPAGSESLLAEATYRFGFHGVTAGRWLSELLRRDYGMPADHFDFGRDLTYALDRAVGAEQRTGVCFYSRPRRRAGPTSSPSMALDLFAKRHPEVDIHIYGCERQGAAVRGDRPRRAARPEQLNDALQPLHRRARAVGDQRVARPARDARGRLHPGRQRRRAEPHGARQLARRLRARDAVRAGRRSCASSSSARSPSASAAAEAAAASVQGTSWDDAGAAVVRIVERVVADAARPRLLRAM